MSKEPLKVEVVELATLKPHPRNYLQHPPEQLDHIAASIKQHGWYRNIVVAKDGTILAGHGVRQAAMERMKWTHGPVVRLPIKPDSPAALKVLTGDNEMGKGAVRDDRLLADLLKEVKLGDELLGTGLDEMMLANLAFITRPASELQDFDAAAHWAGLPGYTPKPEHFTVNVSFHTQKDREKFNELLGYNKDFTSRSIWFPHKDKEDPSSLAYEGERKAPKRKSLAPAPKKKASTKKRAKR